MATLLPRSPMSVEPGSSASDPFSHDPLRDCAETTSLDLLARVARLGRHALRAADCVVHIRADDRAFVERCTADVGSSETPAVAALVERVFTTREAFALDAGAGAGDVAFAGAPIVSSDGHCWGVFCVLDVAPRAWDDEELRLVRDLAGSAADGLELCTVRGFYDYLLRYSPVVAFRDDTGRYATSYVSPNIERILGYPPREVMEVPGWWPAHLHPADREETIAVQEAASRRGAVQHEAEFRLKHRTRGYRWFHGLIHFEHDTEGRPVRTWGFMHEIDRRKRAQEALRHSEQQLRAIFDQAPLGIFVFDEQLRVTRINRRLAAMLGDGLDASAAIHALLGCEPAWQRAARAALGGERSAHEAPLAVGGTDSPTWVRLVVAPLTDHDGACIGGLGMVEDITARMRTEAALRQRDEQLRQAQKMEAIGRLAGGIAHDFNNLLTAIHGNAQLVLEELDPASLAHEDVREIERAAQRASDLTRQLLSISRKQAVRPEVFSLNECVLAIEGILRRLLPATVALETELEDAVWVYADRSQIEQVVLNLAVNARDAMPDGGRLVLRTLRAGPDDAVAETSAPALVALQVVDSGHGIEPAIRHRIFEPFFTTKPPGQGTGLGLAMVYSIVEQSGGQLRLETKVGAGSSFTVYLPAAPPPAAAAAAPEEPQPARTAAGRILVAEDDASVRAFVCRVLRHSGYEVLAAASGDEALRLFEEQQGRIDVLLTDVVMPGMSGTMLAREVLSRAAGSVRVVLMSGYADEVLHGAEGIVLETPLLSKPFSARTLLDALTRAPPAG
jgi:two-component system, cell cycle sensor histidine kinase and response regulator CckA